jgi:hypothetical protein
MNSVTNYSGDTSIGPWVYKTQAAMIRTFQSIGSLQGIRVGAIQLMYGLISFLPKQYFVGFLRVVNFVSRKKEHRADELACLVAGSAACIQGMRKIHGGGMAWMPYWNSEVLPVLEQGCRPDIADGFARFLAAPEIAAQVTEGIASEIAEGKTNPYDTHPPLRDRIAAIERLRIGAAGENSEPALLSVPDTVELQFLKFINPKLEENSLRRVGWDVLGTMVTIPTWKTAVAAYGSFLQGVTAEALPEVIPKLPEIGRQIGDPQGMLLTPQQRTERAGRLLASAIALTLLGKGWPLENQPGQFYLLRGSEKLNVFALVDELVAGKLSGEVWVKRCNELGIMAPRCTAEPQTLLPPQIEISLLQEQEERRRLKMLALRGPKRDTMYRAPTRQKTKAKSGRSKNTALRRTVRSAECGLAARPKRVLPHCGESRIGIGRRWEWGKPETINRRQKIERGGRGVEREERFHHA